MPAISSTGSNGDRTPFDKIKLVALHVFGYENRPLDVFLLADDPGNRMAFEYLMALRLLGRQLDTFVEGLAHSQEPSARPLAMHYQEAIALHRENEGVGAASDRFVVNPEVVDRLTVYRSRYENRTERKKGENGMMDDFEATYWAYYDAARPSGVAR